MFFCFKHILNTVLRTPLKFIYKKKHKRTVHYNTTVIVNFKLSPFLAYRYLSAYGCLRSFPNDIIHSFIVYWENQSENIIENRFSSSLPPRSSVFKNVHSDTRSHSFTAIANRFQ